VQKAQEDGDPRAGRYRRPSAAASPF
jgi:hypothetical protein